MVVTIEIKRSVLGADILGIVVVNSAIGNNLA